MSSTLQGTVNSFKTAKAIMLEDMRRKGQTYRPQAGPSSQEADRHPSAAQAPFKRLGPAKPSQKRAGEFCWHQLATCCLHLLLADFLLVQLPVVCFDAQLCAVWTKQRCMPYPQEVLKGSHNVAYLLSIEQDCMLTSLTAPQLPVRCVIHTHQAQQLQSCSTGILQ